MRAHRLLLSTLVLTTALASGATADPIEDELTAVEAAIAEHEKQIPIDSATRAQVRGDIAEQARQAIERQSALDATALQEIRSSLMEQARGLATASAPPSTDMEATVAKLQILDAIIGSGDIKLDDSSQILDAIIGSGDIKLDDSSQILDESSPAPDIAGLVASGFFATTGLRAPLAGEISGLKRRILSRPDALLVNPAGIEVALDTFSILYVFAEKKDPTGQRWLAVGSRVDQPEGWVPYDATVNWKTMLVMEYAPLTAERQRVLFFNEKAPLESIIQDTSGADEVQTIYAEVEQRRDAGGRVISVEPRRSVSADKPYLMPILEHATSYFNYGSFADVTLLKLAGLTGKASSRSNGRLETDASVATMGAKDPDPSPLRDFKIRIAFVIDTTRSMGAYIEATKDFVRSIYQGLDRRGLLDRFRFGLVGFRDDPNAAPGVEYLTRVFTTFDTPSDINQLFADIDAVRSANVPTADWREDAFAGLRSAINELDWRQGDARMMLLITDASARSETDPKASLPNFGPNTARQMLDQHGISLHVMHIHSDDARRTAGDGEINRAQFQYQTLGRYWGLDGADHRVFSLATERFHDAFMRTLIDAAGGREIQVAPQDESNEFDEYSVIMDFQSGQKLLNKDNIEILDRPIVSDLFRFQQEYLAIHEGVEPPKFYRAWTADHDLVRPTEPSMIVKVLVTRAQLELLAATLEDTIAGVDDKRSNLSEFHLNARAESGRASTDPQLGEIDVAAFLEALPYKSKLLQLTGADFRNYGQGQEDLLNEVRAKLQGYREVLQSNTGWMRISKRSEEELYALPLRDLP